MKLQDLLAQQISTQLKPITLPNLDALFGEKEHQAAASIAKSFDEIRKAGEDLRAKMQPMRVDFDPAKFLPPIGALPTAIRGPRDVFDTLRSEIAKFEKKLDADHEVGAKLASFGNVTIHLSSLKYCGDGVVNMEGIDSNGNPVQLLDNTANLQVLLVALPKQHSEARRIGFVI